MPRRRALRLLLALFTLSPRAAVAQPSAPSPASAERVSATLDWQRAPGAEQCLDAPALEQGVEMRLARRVFVQAEPQTRPTSPAVRIRGRIAPRPGAGFHAELELETLDGESLGRRELETHAEHCSALDESLALVVALMVDIPPEKLPARPVAPAPRAFTPIAVPKTTHAPREPWQVEVTLLGTFGIGLLPEPAVGVRAGVGVAPPAFWLTELEATYWPAQERERGGVGTELGLMTLGLFVCPLTFESGWLGLRICAGQELGRVHAAGFGFDRDREHARLFFDAGARLRGVLRLTGALELRAGIGVALPFSRDRFVYAERDGSHPELFQVAPVVGTGELGLGLHFD